MILLKTFAKLSRSLNNFELNMRYPIFLCLLATSLCSQVAYSQTLAEKIDTLIEQQLPHAIVSVLIKDAQTGQIIYSKNANKLLSPASGTKLFTAAAALYQLKPDYTFLTTLAQKNQDFYLTFSGSPSLTIDNLTNLLLNLQKNGINTINGNIILDGSRFKPPYYAGGYSYDDLGWYYAAPSTAIILNGNAVAYEVSNAQKIGMPIQIKAKTSDPGLTIINEVITADKAQVKEHCNLNIDLKSHNKLRLYGCLAEKKAPQLLQFAITDPILLAKQVIKNTLDKNGILCKGQITTGKTPPDAKLIASIRSKNLSQLITRMLQESDNLYANSLYKQLAYSVTGEGSYKQGSFAMKKILSQHTNLDLGQLEIVDGVGARYNLTTAEQLVVLLTDLYNDKGIQPIFLNALPQAGISGSLKDRMKKTSLEKKVFAKTGTMHDISSLSGYLINTNSKTLIFSIIINGINTPISKAKSLEEQILLLCNTTGLWTNSDLIRARARGRARPNPI
jgi:serine-type D-Ala-D-Ala carboxypeptidase/endopeptidase (penicillin-binding protein 4)